MKGRENIRKYHWTSDFCCHHTYSYTNSLTKVDSIKLMYIVSHNLLMCTSCFITFQIDFLRDPHFDMSYFPFLTFVVFIIEWSTCETCKIFER